MNDDLFGKKTRQKRARSGVLKCEIPTRTLPVLPWYKGGKKWLQEKRSPEFSLSPVWQAISGGVRLLGCRPGGKAHGYQAFIPWGRHPRHCPAARGGGPHGASHPGRRSYRTRFSPASPPLPQGSNRRAVVLRRKQENKVWMFYAICGQNGEILAAVWGKRTKKTLKALLEQLSGLEIDFYCTDLWRPFTKVFDAKQHLWGKAHTKCIE